MNNSNHRSLGRNFYRLVGSVAIITLIGLYMYTLRADMLPVSKMYNVFTEGSKGNFGTGHPRKSIKIIYYNPPPYVIFRQATDGVDFNLCDFSNCQLTLNKSLVNESDVVIFDGRFSKQMMYRVPGQIWIFSAHESPAHYGSGEWRRSWKSNFNFTMTYDRETSDIYWPYGDIRPRTHRDIKNFTSIFLNKTKDVLIINSHCSTQSKREKFITELGKYIEVDTLGRCGKQWNCGKHFVHDDCFSIINKYKFYLAFENSLCRSYFTEKFFENYDYDSIMVVRGGKKGEALNQFPEGTFISTDSFDSARDLGIYLKKLASSVTEYSRMLDLKSNFHFPGYKIMFQETMCRLCNRLNTMHGMSYTIPDIADRVYRTKPCSDPNDI